MANQSEQSKSNHWRELGKSTQEILNVRGEIAAHSGPLGRGLARIGRALATPYLLLGLLVFHLGWVLLNLPLWPWPAWDPYPFTFLATLASVEAPLLTSLVLMSQQRDRRIADLRDEIHLQVSLHVERQSTMTLRLLRELQAHMQMQSRQEDETLQRMQSYLDPQELLENLRKDFDSEGENT